MRALAVNDETALLRGIIANPADDTARLVFADWLDEHAEPPRECPAMRCDGPCDAVCRHCHGTGTVSDDRHDRAEFIRVQCELARHDPERCPDCLRIHVKLKREGRGVCHGRVGLILKQNYLLTDDRGREWARVPWGGGDAFDFDPHRHFGQRILNQAIPHFHRGFVSRVEVPGLEWVFERVAAMCPECGGEWSGGSLACPKCDGDAIVSEWRVTPWALAVGAAHPVTEWDHGLQEPLPRLDWGEWTYNGVDIPEQVRALLEEFYPTDTEARRAFATRAADVVRAAVLEAWAQEVSS